jgi:citrate synthase
MESNMVWMTAEEALGVLSVRPQTLYANVSRGKIRAKPDDDDPRRSLYHRDDVLRMARRSNGRRKVEAVSAQAMQYGDPVLSSSLTTTVGGLLLYRGQDAAVLAETATLEDIAALLWDCDAALVRGGLPASMARHGSASDVAPGALGAGLVALAQRCAVDPPSLGRLAGTLHAEAADILATLAQAMIRQTATSGPGGSRSGSGDGGPGGSGGGLGGSGPGDGGPREGDCGGGIHVRLARAWRCEAAEDLIRRTLVLLADHELNASTFATRVAISTGASLSAGVLAGFATLTGPLHGGASAELAQLLTLADQIGPSDAVRQWLASDRPLPAFGHPLYAEGDPRARALLKLLPELQPYQDLAIAAEAQAGELPNIDYALSLLATACGAATGRAVHVVCCGSLRWLARPCAGAGASQPPDTATGPLHRPSVISAGIY